MTTPQTAQEVRASLPSALPADAPDDLARDWALADVRFAIDDGDRQAKHARAVKELFSCIKVPYGTRPILQEGGIYMGCWLESTGTINAELLQRFLPGVARNTFRAFAEGQREDGMLPYKLTTDGPVFNQVQIVTPLARCVWRDHMADPDPAYLRQMYGAMARYDAWLTEHRDTRGTGAVEAFCNHDTGHDMSGRFWHVPDFPRLSDGRRYRADNPLLPLIAPDLTAFAYAQRRYLALMAEELGEDPAPWQAAAAATEAALWEQCFDPEDGFFYDRDPAGRLMRIQSDTLLRVLACEVGDDTFFEAALRHYLLNTRKFFARYPPTSMALDDPRFDPQFAQNSWSGPTNFLSIIRAPHAFEHHGRFVELTWYMQPILQALWRLEEFGQTLSPFNGQPGFTRVYSPSILCLLDFVERLFGILPRPDGTLWFTAGQPVAVEGHDRDFALAYGRTVDGQRMEWQGDGTDYTAFADGRPLFTVPYGVRVVTDRQGRPRSLIGMVAGGVSGHLTIGEADIPFRIAPNQVLNLQDGTFRSTANPGLVLPEV